MPHAGGRNQLQQAVRHADTRAQYRHDRKFLPGNDRRFHLRHRRFDRALGERQIARHVVTHQQSDFPQQLAEGPCGSVLVPHVRELVLDQRVIEDEQVRETRILLHGGRPEKSVSADPWEGASPSARLAANHFRARHGNLSLPGNPPGPPNPPGMPSGMTIEELCCRRNSCNSLTARSTATAANPANFPAAWPRESASISNASGSAPTGVMSWVSPT